MTRKLVIPVLPSELAAALLAVGIAYLYEQVGLAAIALFGIVLFTFQYLLGQLLLSEERAEELERSGEQLRSRTEQLATLQVGRPERDHAHAGPARQDDRAPLRGRRSLRA